MPENNSSPILSIIVRRFPPELAGEIESSIKNIQRAVADQPGFINLKNQITIKKDDCEVVTLVSFDTHANLEEWEKSSVRAGYAKELDELTHGSATNAKFGGIQQLASPSSHISKVETVVILILWILVLNQISSFALRPILSVVLTPVWQNVVQTSIVVLIISYLLMPYTSLKLTRLKAKFRS